MQIGRKDIYWNYAATFLKIASSVLLIPFILRMMPTEMIGIWTVFMTITSFTMLLDFGFNPSFTRNITYVFSGVSRLKTSGFDHISTIYQTVDYGLLKWSQCIRQYLRELKDTVVVIDYTCTYVHV